MLKIPLPIKFIFFFSIPFLAASYFLVRIFSTEPEFSSPGEEIAYYSERQNNFRAAEAALGLLEKDTLVFSSHVIFLEHYFSMRQKERNKLKNRMPHLTDSPEKYYLQKISSANETERDIGLYGWCKYKLFIHPVERPSYIRDSLGKIKNKNQPGINQLLGEEMYYSNPAKATVYFERELKFSPTNKKAVESIIRLSLSTRVYEYASFYVNYADENAIQLNPGLKREVYFHSSFASWISEMYRGLFTDGRSIEISVAFIVLLLWLIYLIRVDFYRDISLKFVVLILLFSMVLVPLVLVAYDLVYFNFLVDGENIFFNQVFITGLFEETFKLLPALLVFTVFRKKIISPYFLLFLACISSLYFSFLENVYYFSDYYDVRILAGRAIYSTTLHVITGSLSAYGFILVYFSRNRRFVFPLYFSAAVLVHAVYNYSLYGEYGIITVPLLIAGTFAFSSMLNNCLNNSKNLNENKAIDTTKPALVLIAGFTLILALGLLFTASRFGFSEGEKVFTGALIHYGWMIPVFSFALTRFEPEKGKWNSLDITGNRKINSFPGKETCIVLTPFLDKGPLLQGEMIRAAVSKKIRHNNSTYYLCTGSDEKFREFLIQFKDEQDDFYDYNAIVFIYKISADGNSNPVERSKYAGMVKCSPCE